MELERDSFPKGPKLHCIQPGGADGGGACYVEVPGDVPFPGYTFCSKILI